LQGGDEKYIKYFDGKLEGKEPLGKPRRRWEDNIRVVIREIV
jgi:hypothetical protein